MLSFHANASTEMLYECNDSRAKYPNICVHELFEQRVARDLKAVAVVFK